MRHARRGCGFGAGLVSLVVALVFTPGGASAAERQSDPESSDFERLWDTDLGSEPSGVVAAGNTVVTVDPAGEVSAFGRGGSPAWTVRASVEGQGMENILAPVALGSTVVLVGELEDSGNAAVMALDSGTGDELWTRSTEKRVLGSSLAGGEGVAFFSHGNAVEALDADDGSVVWTVGANGGVASSSPWSIDGVAEGVLLGTTQTPGGGYGSRSPIGLSVEDGSEVFFETDVDAAWSALDGDTFLVASSDLAPDQGTGDPPKRAVGAVDPTSGEVLWSVAADWPFQLFGAREIDGQLVLSAPSLLVSYDIDDGGELWRLRPDDLGLEGARFAAGGRGNGDRLMVAASGIERDATTGDRADTGRVFEVSEEGIPGSPMDLAGSPTNLVADDDAQVLVTALDEEGNATLVVLGLPAQVDVPEDSDPVPVLAGLPTPGEAITAKNAGLAAGLMALLVVFVVIPSTLFNEALEARIAQRPQRETLLGRVRGKFSRGPGGARASGRDSPHAWRNLLVYTGLSALIYSLLQPRWGPNIATVATAVSFWVALMMMFLLEAAAIRAITHRRHGSSGGRPELWFGSLGIAGLCVAGSRAIGFVPGYLYGVVANYETGTELSEDDKGAIVLGTVTLVLVVTVASWFALGPLDQLGDGWWQVPASITGGVFMAGVETLMIGMLPLALLPGSTLRSCHPGLWKLVWGSAAALFCLVLLHPGLVTASARSTGWILVVAAGYGGVALAYWYWVKSRSAVTQRPGVAGLPADEDPASVSSTGAAVAAGEPGSPPGDC